jgi:segregation and condensation protein A
MPSLKEIDLVELIHEPEWKTILLDIVESEKMDVWSIDLCELADKYLARINSMTELDLRVPANAILASAILLKAKAKLLRISSLEDEEEKQKEMDKLIEEFIPELRNPRKIREGRISLDELVNAIEKMVQKSKQKRMKLLEREEPVFKIPFSKEDLDKRMEEVFSLIQQNLDSEGIALFSNLLKERTPKEMVSVFIPLLFLANKGKVNVWQDEFFGEIYITVNKENKEQKIEKNGGL